MTREKEKKSWFSSVRYWAHSQRRIASASVTLLVPCRHALVKEYLRLRAVQGTLVLSAAMWSSAVADLVWKFDLFNMLERLIRHLLGGVFG